MNLRLVLLAAAALAMGCEGPVGPEGPMGAQGLTGSPGLGIMAQSCPAGQQVQGITASGALTCGLELSCSGSEPVMHVFRVAFTKGAAFGVTAPAVVIGTFDVPCSLLKEANGTKSGSQVSNLSVQIGSQVFEASTATNPNVQGVQVTNNRVTGLAMNFLQDGDAALQMGVNGQVFAFRFSNQGVPLEAPVGGQKIGRLD